MNKKNIRLKRVLGFAPTYGAAVGLVVSGTAMFSVGTVAGRVGYATFISAFIALIPMMMAAFAFGELTAMLPGGGMISDYTLPAMGRFWATFSLLSGYVVLIATDGGAQLVIGGLAIQKMVGIPQLLVTLIMLLCVVIINVFNVGIYGKVETVITIFMMILFAMLSICGCSHLGELYTGAVPQNLNSSLKSDLNWSSILSNAGAAVWFFIGFEFACPMAEENVKPYKNIPYALIFGLLTICLVDSLFAFAAVRYTDVNILQNSSTPQLDAATAMLGKTGSVIMVCLTFFAAFTTANAYIASLPRMLYGLAREKLVPSFFAKINSRTRTPIYGIIFTSTIIFITVCYITLNGARTEVVQGLINIASITWLVSYGIAMLDVLILRKKYPQFPRLWKAPLAKITMPVGLIGVIFSIYTLRDSLLYAIICMIIISIYILIWGRMKKVNMKEIPNIKTMVSDIRERAEYLEIWDEAVDKWCRENE